MTTKRTNAQRKAEREYIKRQKEMGVRARKFMVNDSESECLRAVESFIKQNERNIKLVLDFMGNR